MMRLVGILLVILAAIPVPGAVTLDRTSSSVNYSEIAVEYTFSGDLDIRQIAESRVYARSDRKADTDWNVTAGVRGEKSITGKWTLAEFPEASKIYAYAELKQNGQVLLRTPELVVAVDAIRQAAALSSRIQSLETSDAEKQQRIDELEKTNKSLSEIAAAVSNAAPDVIRAAPNPIVTPDFAVVRFQTFKGADPAASKVEVEVQTPQGSLTFRDEEVRAEHSIKLSPNRVDTTQSEKFTFTARAIDGSDNVRATAKGMFELPARVAPGGTDLVVTGETDRGFTVNVTPKTPGIVRLELKKDGKRVGYYGDDLAVDEWKRPRAALRPAGVTLPFVFNALEPDAKYDVVVETIDQYGQRLETKTAAPATRATFAFKPDTFIEVTPGGYKVYAFTTANVKSAKYRVIGGKLETLPRDASVENNPKEGGTKIVAEANIDDLSKLGQPATVELIATDDHGVSSKRTAVITFALGSVQDIKRANPTLNEAQVKSLYDQVAGKKKIDWKGLAVAGIKALVLAP